MKYRKDIAFKIIYNCKYMENTKEVRILEFDKFAGVYKEIALTFGTEIAIEMHKLFKGQQIIFPQRLYSKEFIYNYVRKNYNGSNIRELSQMFGYSDRRIRQIISDM